MLHERIPLWFPPIPHLRFFWTGKFHALCRPLNTSALPYSTHHRHWSISARLRQTGMNRSPTLLTSSWVIKNHILGQIKHSPCPQTADSPLPPALCWKVLNWAQLHFGERCYEIYSLICTCQTYEHCLLFRGWDLRSLWFFYSNIFQV